MGKKVFIGGIASVLVVACVVAACVTLTRHDENSSSKEVGTSTKSVESMCQPTPYKQTCEKTLSAAKNVTDPKDYIKVAFEATVSDIKNVIMNTETIKKAASDPYTKDALLACEEMFNIAVDDLRNSVLKMDNIDFTKIKDIVDDIKTWLSAVVTYEETCLDAFSKTEQGETRAKMVKLLNTTRELSINGLHMVDSFGELISQTTDLSRKLLTTSSHDEFVEARNRKLLQISSAKPNAVVALDGSGQYNTIQAAVNAVPKKNVEPYVIFIKAGTYKEHVSVENSMTNIALIGEGPTKTIITGNLGVKNGGNMTTYHTCSLCVAGGGAVIMNMGIENTAGPEKEQAVALRVNADRSVIYNCKIDGHQDTLYAHGYRQFYRDCTISGTIDFIFGDASAVFQNCKLIVRKPGHNQAVMITAQGRVDLKSSGAFVIQNCEIKAEPAFTSTQPPIKAYLGRPWKEYSRTIIMQSFIDGFIDPTGWAPWNQSDFGLHTCYYTEYQNRGPGAALDKRVSNWGGYKKGISGDEINKFTPSKFLNSEETWLPKADVPYEPGMMKV
ncbi:pectinesterase-like [Lycium barbarum]|uniref:pectinesterase-like n=1 Tax=Lycium barbarum TaxID=112863 RepID=UPI00293F7292|nr:pectinesterase-like [Lycium barbarum]